MRISASGVPNAAMVAHQLDASDRAISVGPPARRELLVAERGSKGRQRARMGSVDVLSPLNARRTDARVEIF